MNPANVPTIALSNRQTSWPAESTQAQLIKPFMFGTAQLKPNITITETSVECPVSGCGVTVERARQGQPLSQEQFLCQQHRIYVSPSTFEYENEFENLLWHDSSDRERLSAIKRVKRESRLARDNSEDALTWNVFRYLEKNDGLAAFLSTVITGRVANPLLSYWSYSETTAGVSAGLKRARDEFGELPARGSEPDLIIEAEGKLIWVEAKLGSPNETAPKDSSNTKKYLSGGDRWFEKAFVSDYEAVALKAKRYELMRLWLLGTWIAQETGKEFHLINLVREQSREELFRSHLSALPNAHFSVATWEQVYHWLTAQGEQISNAQLLERYLREKSAGYTAGHLVAAFPSLTEQTSV